MSKRQPGLLIEDILESGNKILAYTQNLTFDAFIADSKTVDAVFEISKLLVKQLPDFPKNSKKNTPT